MLHYLPSHNNNNGGQEHSPIDPTEHFQWGETCGDIIPTVVQLNNLEHLCCIMEDIRSLFGQHPRILKCLSEDPTHQTGEAVNFQIPGQAPRDTLQILLANKISFPFSDAYLITENDVTSVHMTISDSEAQNG